MESWQAAAARSEEPDDTGEPAIAAFDVQKTFGKVQALDGVTFRVEPGEVLALLGANGAGKSTLLRVLGTTVLPDHGTVRVQGIDVVVDPASVRREIGVALGDERSWYFRLSGRENLAFFGVLCGLSRRAALARADELLRDVGLADAGQRRFDGYSSGMRARLSLARALVVSPEVILLDEPTRTLDPIAAADFRQRVLRLSSEEGRTLVFATHDLHEAAAVATRVMVLAQGRVALMEDGGMDAAALEEAVHEAAGVWT